MRFLVSFTECVTAGEAERLALLRLRTEAFDYWFQRVGSGSLVWAFASADATMTFCLIEPQSLEALDAIVKRSPMFPYANVCCTPTISSEAVAREILASLCEAPLAATPDLPSQQLDREVEADGEYWLVYKACPPFRATESSQRQRDVLEQTVVAKTTVDPHIEFADLNVAGQMAGYLIGMGPRERVEQYVANCAVGDGIEWHLKPLVSVERALRMRVRVRET